MEPSSGPPRPALQPLADGDPVLGASHLARFEFSDAGTKILMVEWMPEAKDAGTGETAAITATTTTTTTTITADADAGADADAAADTNEARTTEQSQAGTQPSGGLPAVAEGEGVDTATAAAAATPAATTTNTATFDSTSTSGASAHDAGAAISGPESAAWQVSWPGKSTFLPARDMDVDGDEASSGTNTNNSSPRRRRIYFLLPVETPVPATVTITPPGRGDDPIRVEPLPAIFPESLVSSVTPGPRGVLHTIWAKKRLSELEREMDAEMRANAESVGLEMALAEKQWIESNFFAQPPSSASAAAPTSPPRSPLYGRMAEKLSGLRLATSPADLVPSGMFVVFLFSFKPLELFSCPPSSSSPPPSTQPPFPLHIYIHLRFAYKQTKTKT